LHATQPHATPHLAGLRIPRIFNDGARSRRPQSEKFADDAVVLRRALAAEPDNARYAFYLAQSLRDAGEPLEAIAAYERRVAMGGWAEEVYTATLEIARLRERVSAPYAEIVAAYLDAYDFRPSRAEAPCELARWFRTHARHTLARDYAGIASALPMTGDVLFIDRSVYDWRARDELAVAAYWCGDRALSAELCRELLADARLPERERARVAKNLEFAQGAAN
jgi:tetratricopeptide (TPR) repeat protein